MGKRILLFILCMSMLFSFAACSSGDAGELSDPEYVTEKTLLKEGVSAPVNNSTGIPMAPEYLGIVNSSGNYKYVLFEDSDEALVNVYAMPEAKLSEIVENTELDSYIMEVGAGKTFLKDREILSQIESNALTVISNLTLNEGLLLNTPEAGEVSYLTYNRLEWDNSAFGCIFKDDMTATEYMQSENLRLLCDSPVVKKVIYNEKIGEITWSSAVVVEAEVFCAENSGAFKKLSWIPKEGRSEALDFIVTFWTYTDTTGQHMIAVGDIYVIGQDSSGNFLQKLKNIFG